jgi:PAS domain-containing protein
MLGGIGSLVERIQHNPEVHRIFDGEFHGVTWLTVTFLSLVAIVLLPRQFHVTVVENNSEKEIRRAAWLFPVYLVLINLFVVPIAAAGLLSLPKGSFDADTYVLALPLSAGAHHITLLAFVGGLSAATAMVIVDSVALAIMVSNGLVLPLLLRRRGDEPKGQQQDMTGLLLAIRRVAIFAVVLLGYLFYRLLGQAHGLASIGLVSFAAVAQFAPAFFGGLVWRHATARGAISGILAGFAVWSYTLLLPWIIEAGWMSRSLLVDGPFGFDFLAPRALFYVHLDPLSHGVLWSMAVNVAVFVAVSMLKVPEPIERLQALVFVPEALARPPMTPSFRRWRTSVTAGDLQSTVARYLGAERAERSFAEYAASRSAPTSLDAEADIHLLRFSEHLLASAIGAASSRLVLSLLLRRRDAGSQSALRLLDDASEALQYNRDLLQSALDQVRHGLSVFDKDMQLICWNRQFRELLNLPQQLGQVGVPLDRILRTCAERGDFGAGDIDRLVADRLARLALTHETFQEKFAGGRRIIEIRTSPMPQGGIVTTYSDITDRVAASEALARANETLERRVKERTAELTEVNEALAVAKRKADQANLDKTRFLAAASHDELQPALRDESGRARDGRPRCDASPQHRCLVGGGRGDPGRANRDLPPRHGQAGAGDHGFSPAGGFREARGGVPASGTREEVGAAGGGHPGVGTLRPAVAAPRAPEPPVQCHQVHACRQGAAGSAPARRPAHRARVRHRSRNPAVQACPHLPGVRAPDGDSERRAWVGARSFDSRAHRKGAGPSRRVAVGARPRLDVLRRVAARCAAERGGARGRHAGAVGRTHRRVDGTVHRQRACRPARHAGFAGRVGVHRHRSHERRGSHRAACRKRRPPGHHPRGLPFG